MPPPRESNDAPVQSATRPDPLRQFRRLIIGGTAIMLVLVVAAYFMGAWVTGALEKQVTDQAWAGYVGTVFATAVALAGSIVAIQLANRALDTSEVQSSLAEQSNNIATVQSAIAGQANRIADMQTDLAARSNDIAEKQVSLANRANEIADTQAELSTQANQIAERQSTESVLAVEGAAHYQRFKSMLITMPATLRRSQRDGLFTENAQLALIEQVVRIVGTAIDGFLSSNVPAMAVALAGSIETHQRANGRQPAGQVREQRYFEFGISSLQYDLAVIRVALALPPGERSYPDLRLQFIRLLHATYALVRACDELFIFAAGTGDNGAGKFSLLQGKFVTEVAPVAKLNRNLNLPNDFSKFAQQVQERLTAADILCGGFGVDFLGENGGGLLVALHDSGFSEALTRIQALLRGEGKTYGVIRLDDGDLSEQMTALPRGSVPIFFITEDFSDRLLQLRGFLASAGAADWPERVVVLDQVEQPPAISNPGRYLSFSEHLECWRFFVALQGILVRGQNAVQRDGGGEADDRARFLARVEGGFDNSLNMDIWRTALGVKRDDLVAMVTRAVGTLDADGDPAYLARATVDLCELLVAGVREPATVGAGETFPSFDEDDPAHAALVEVIATLAKAPLVERPLFRLPNSRHGTFLSNDFVDLYLPGTAIFGVGYLDSSFKLARTPLIAALTQRAAYHLF